MLLGYCDAEHAIRRSPFPLLSADPLIARWTGSATSACCDVAIPTISPWSVTPISMTPPVAFAKAQISRPRLEGMERLNSVVKPSPRAVMSWSEKFEVTAFFSFVEVSLHEWSINQGLEILAHHRALFHSI